MYTYTDTRTGTYTPHLNARSLSEETNKKNKLNVNFNKQRFMKGIDRRLHVYSKSQTHASNNINKFLKERSI